VFDEESAKNIPKDFYSPESNDSCFYAPKVKASVLTQGFATAFGIIFYKEIKLWCNG
jgi:hypothetical protein